MHHGRELARYLLQSIQSVARARFLIDLQVASPEGKCSEMNASSSCRLGTT